MKTYFAEPSIEVVNFNVADVITASGEEDDDLWTMMPPCA